MAIYYDNNDPGRANRKANDYYSSNYVPGSDPMYNNVTNTATRGQGTQLTTVNNAAELIRRLSQADRTAPTTTTPNSVGGIVGDVANKIKSAATGTSGSGNDGSTGYGSGSGSGYGTGTTVNPLQSYYDELYDLFQKQNEEARQNRLNAIIAQLQATKDAYGAQQRQVGDEYDKLVDQNEVRKFRAKRIARENQANLGITDTGLGRQEALDLNLGYDNKTIDLKKTKQQAIDEIANLMIQAEAEAENNKAQINDTYDNALLQWRLANLGNIGG